MSNLYPSQVDTKSHPEKQEVKAVIQHSRTSQNVLTH